MELAWWQALMAMATTGIGGFTSAWVMIRRIRVEEKGGERKALDAALEALERERVGRAHDAEKHRRELYPILDQISRCIQVHAHASIAKIYIHRIERLLRENSLPLPDKPEGYEE